MWLNYLFYGILSLHLKMFASKEFEDSQRFRYCWFVFVSFVLRFCASRRSATSGLRLCELADIIMNKYICLPIGKLGDKRLLMIRGNDSQVSSNKFLH